MPVLLARSDLSRGDLKLFLTNENGYSQDGFNVRWTLFRSDGTRASGKSLPAMKACTGEYYAPWCVSDRNGCYEIVWEYQEGPGLPVIRVSQPVFVVAVSSYGPCGPVSPDAIPGPGCLTFLSGQSLTRGDLSLFLSGPDGFPSDAFAVFWTVHNAVGVPVSQKTVATRAATGEYFASWTVGVNSGDYTIRWEWMESFDGPLESKSQPFSVINPATP